MSAEILNNDDCNINIVNNIDIPLELTRMYLQYYSSSHWITQDTVFDIYKEYREKIEKLKEGNEEDED